MYILECTPWRGSLNRRLLNTYKVYQISNIDNLVVYHHNIRYYRFHIRIFKVENIAITSVEVKITQTSASSNTRTKDYVPTYIFGESKNSL